MCCDLWSQWIVALFFRYKSDFHKFTLPNPMTLLITNKEWFPGLNSKYLLGQRHSMTSQNIAIYLYILFEIIFRCRLKLSNSINLRQRIIIIYCFFLELGLCNIVVSLFTLIFCSSNMSMLGGELTINVSQSTNAVCLKD